MPLRGPDMSDMRLEGVSMETPDSEGSESMAVGLGVPLGSDGAALPLPRMDRVAGCWKQLVRP